jgi:hypothetical protein
MNADWLPDETPVCARGWSVQRASGLIARTCGRSCLHIRRGAASAGSVVTDVGVASAGAGRQGFAAQALPPCGYGTLLAKLELNTVAEIRTRQPGRQSLSESAYLRPGVSWFHLNKSYNLKNFEPPSLCGGRSLNFG